MSSDVLRHVEPAVRAISARGLALREAPVKLNRNEDPYDLPAGSKQSVLERARARSWSRHPELDPDELPARLAEASGWHRDGIPAGNGSNAPLEQQRFHRVSR